MPGPFNAMSGSVCIIGGGASAVVFAATALKDLQMHLITVHAPGKAVPLEEGQKKDVWSSVGTKHYMGQTKALLSGNVLPADSRSATFTSGKPADDADLNKLNRDHSHLAGFLTADEFRKGLEKLLEKEQSVGKGRLALVADWVHKVGIKADPNKGNALKPYVQLKSAKAKELFFDHVVVAAGTGVENPFTLLDKKIQATTKDGRICTGGTFLEQRTDCEPTSEEDAAKWCVFVYGGSATAAWVAELALHRGYQVVAWGTGLNRGEGGNSVEERFAGAFPPGDRNAVVQKFLEKQRLVCAVKTVVECTDGDGKKMWKIAWEGPKAIASDLPNPLIAHQIIYALGNSNATLFGPDCMIDTTTVKLGPKYDYNYSITGNIGSERKLLGFGTENNEVLYIGAGVDTVPENIKNLVKRAVGYGTIAETLPKALVPAQGIGLLMAAIEAFNDYMPVMVTKTKNYRPPDKATAKYTPATMPKGPDGKPIDPTKDPNPFNDAKDRSHAVGLKWDINMNTANRTQLAVYLASVTDLPAPAANFAVALIVALRAKTVHGLSDQSIGGVIAFAELFYTADVKFWREMSPTWLDCFADVISDNLYRLPAMKLSANDQAAIENSIRQKAEPAVK